MNWMRLTTLVACLIVVAVSLGSAAETTTMDLEFFEKKIRPLLHDHCYSCHSADAKSLKGGLRLDSQAGLLTGGDTGAAVVPGKPDESLLIESVRYGPDSYQMPPTGKLADEEIAALVDWVGRGAPYPETEAADLAPQQEIDFEEGRKFWSFQPLERQPLPEVSNAAWPRGRIDAFILAALDQHGLTPSPETDRLALIRRLTFDLIGLPPTPGEVRRFVENPSEDAVKELVNRLLASPHYGERWGRLWLDLARYTDTTAEWLDGTAQAHFYRDWVVQSLNDDLPYDQFVRRQLATDMIDETGPEDLPALGFLGLSPTYWKELLLPPDIIKVIVADEWEERIDAVSRTFLGLTVACARCHDHKFDPIGMEDYYALAGVFASCRLGEKPLIPADQYEPARLAKEEVKKLTKQVEALGKQKPPPKEEIQSLEAKIVELKKTPNYDAPLANVVVDESLDVVLAGDTPQSGTKLNYKPDPQNLHLFIRGNPNRLGAEVSRRFLRVLAGPDAQPFTKGSGRLELADSIVQDAAPLVARVMVNRIWAAHFGRGLVDSPSNFGKLGSAPSHPELLEDLAAGFIESGWSLKWLHRQIVLSATYRQSSGTDRQRIEIDPDNRWLSRMNRRRLDVELWRDAMLAASGQLDPALGGPSLGLDDAKNVRRTIYTTIHRRDMAKMLQIHDFPDPNAHSPQRVSTTTPLQGLYVLNSPFIAAQAAALAVRVRREAPQSVDEQVQRAYWLAFSRPANDEEVQLAMAYLGEMGGASDAAWQQYAHALLGSNEFLFID